MNAKPSPSIRHRLPSRLRSLRQRLGAILHEGAWWIYPEARPSFLASYKRYRRNYFAALAELAEPWGTLWNWETKLGVRALAASQKILTPEIYQGPMEIGGIDWRQLPPTFVIKPDRGAGKAGVYVLRRRSAENYTDLIRGRAVTEADVMAELRAASDKGEISGSSIIAEAALLREGDGIAFDWKCYAFQGEVALIWQISRGAGERHSRFLDSGWRDLGPVRRGLKVTSTLPPPTMPEAILDAASRLSVAVPAPFVRVDLYEHAGKIYLGEMTPMPGSGQRFTRELDLAMGEAWQRAERRLMVATRRHLSP